MKPTKIELWLRRIISIISESILNNKFTFAIIIALILSLAFYVLVFKKFNSDLQGFPFNSQVWGDMSSWWAVGASLTAVVLLYKTYQSQLLIQRYTQAQTAVVLDKHLPDLMPNIAFGTDYAFTFRSHHDSHVTIEFEGAILNAGKNAYNVSWVSNDYIHVLGETGSQSIRVWKGKERRFFNIPATGIPVGSDGKAVYEVLLKYEDRLKNQYEQKLIFKCDFRPEIKAAGPLVDGKPRVQSRPPEISNYERETSDPLLVRPYFPFA